jgi:outer membrane protein assembly factor BamB
MLVNVLSCAVWLALLGAAFAEDAPVRPIMAGNHFVQPLTGEILGTVPGASSYDMATPLPGPEGRFRIGKLLVDAATQKVTASVVEEISFEDKSVVRRDPAGKVIWSQAMAENPGGVRPPDRIAFDSEVFVAVRNEVVALDRETGAEKWRAVGEPDRFLVSGSLLLSTSCSSPADPKHGRCLVARDRKTGTEVFRAALPADSDPDAIREIGDFFVVSDVGFARSHPAYTRCFDRTGKLLFELPEHPAVISAADKDVVIVTPSRTARIDAQGKTLWETKDFHAGNDKGSRIAALPGGDLVVLAWEPISDEGVDVMRLTASDGKIAWKTHCEGLGVAHSKYWQSCYVEVRGKFLIVVSQATGGHFVEALDAEKGESVKRTLVH